MIDLLVAGAGPAGLATAIHAAMAGLDVVVVEPRDTPIDKACGEGLMPGAVHALAALGVRLDGRPFHGIRYLDGIRVAEARFHGGVGLGVRRTSLHAALASRAQALGIPVVSAQVTDLRQRGNAVSAAGMTARYLVGADGLHSRVRRLVGLEVAERGSARHGLRRHFRVPAWTDFVEVHWAPRGEAYVTPVGPDLVGVAVLTADRGRFVDHLRWFPDLAARLDGAIGGPVLGAGPLRQRVRRRVAGRVLLAGDAAGYVDALTGEGISVALAAGQRLVRCVQAGTPERYEREWRRVSRAYRLVTGSLVWTRNRPALASCIVPAAARLPGVFRGAIGLLE